MTRCLEASINLLQRRRFASTCGTAQIDGKVLRREYRLYGVALLCPETCLRYKVIVATQGQVAMDAMIDNSNHAALALKACLGCDVTADLKQFALQYLELIAPAQLSEIELAPAMTHCLCHQLVVLGDRLALKQC